MFVSSKNKFPLLDFQKASLAIVESGTKLNIKPNIIVTNDESLSNDVSEHIVSSPGEYEILDIFIYSANDSNNKNTIFSFDAEGVQVLYLGKGFSGLDKRTFEMLPDVDLMIVALDKVDENIVETISDFDPQYLIPLGEKKEIEELANKMGISLPEAVSKFKISESDISSEDYSTTLVLLN